MFKGILQASMRPPHSSDLSVKLSITLCNEKILFASALPMPSKTDAVRHLFARRYISSKGEGNPTSCTVIQAFLRLLGEKISGIHTVVDNLSTH
jgi:hypothetical protein